MEQSKTDERRSAIVDRLADHVLAHGLVSASLRPLAKAAGTSDRMLLYYFTDKSELLAATLQRIAERMTIAMADHAAPEPLPLPALQKRLASLLFEDRFWPYMCIWIELASRAARGDPLYSPIAAAIGQGFLAWGEAQLAAKNDAERARDAAKLLVAIEGMMLVRAIGLHEVANRSLD
ncbi:MAG TPA: TetR/AcrR family transcriptional regulator [Sphingorhabdus sp.]|jgi:AcrR family transcriptional regulator|uniref:TetR/AcrR family transcriptional regulator n=1 Tax=Sphingorhabdus sp. TaxID=1902408 RepID=UPI002CE63EED|nr:TetR/AcrR family transcriptional regulator [Sphingorhabdus sp.]HMT40956.1 TetR/AcrR family transcriptional regulator [Sphingorhabdus sp.]HMU20994.1 TetR/AcrR family transcriptional regulator [Sphingorhabdus sp.]